MKSLNRLLSVCSPLLLATGLLFSGCQSGNAPPEVKGEAQKVDLPVEKIRVHLNQSQLKTIHIEVVQVAKGSVPVILTLTGAVQAIPNQTLRIGTPLPGKIENISANLEDLVHAGQTLITLFSNDIGTAQADLLNTLLDLEASRRQAETDLQLAQSVFDRETRLYDLKVSARADMEAARANYNKVSRQLGSIQNKRHALIEVFDKRLQLIGASAGSAKYVAKTGQLQPRVYLKTPKNGLVIARNANPGEWVDANTEILTIADLSRVWVVAQATDKDLPRLQVGQTVDIQLDNRPDQSLQGHIAAIGSEVHADTRTVDVRVEVSNEQRFLKPNLFARVQINVGNQTGLLIPKLAIQTFGDQKIVYLQQTQDRFVQKPVQVINDTSNNNLVVIKGLTPSDKVVTEGSFALHGEWLKQQF